MNSTAEKELIATSFLDWQKSLIKQSKREDILLWGSSFIAVLTIGAALLWWAMHVSPPEIIIDEPPPAAIAIDMTPMSVTTPPQDVALGPQQTQSQSEAAEQKTPEISAPPSPAPNPPIAVPKAQKPHKVVKKRKPLPVVKKLPPKNTPPAETTTAPPSTEAPPAPSQAAPAPGHSSAKTSHNLVTWQGAVLGRLEKFKRYPSEAMESDQEGVPHVTFSMDRNGKIISVKLAKKSGHSLLDEEALSLPKRAEPLPPPPDTVKGNVITLTVPIEFYIH
ncbi:TonB family protein [Aristophania vespae]|uniref:TonB family protein n=1 Tax=Aristophania vespae TaxID=2697033 RepID=A0A6P1NJV7_9PROT|nr:energy transducer TonB [Aristophania vespae]QHI95962.1 TonB family protein [Aristophania vespae]UMM63714.1 hypothetical protein DM15PD_06890 [Aristophania vespae]